MVTLTETAAKKIADLRLEEGKPEWGLRVRIVGGGCSGMSYELGWEDQQAADDRVVEAASRSTSTSTARRISKAARSISSTTT
jgi:iron-sulfur cluster assembly accessory protein